MAHQPPSRESGSGVPAGSPIREAQARGRFITFEGGEGVGKSTQIQRLSARLTAEGVDHLVTREPGGCDLAETIRTLLVTGRPGGLAPETELFLMLAARSEHVHQVIRPALARGTWVLCDRFHDSTVAYQGFGQGQELALIYLTHKSLFGDVTPDLTLFLDLEPEDGLRRSRSRGGEAVRFEEEALAFHERVHMGFFMQAALEPARFQVVDASLEESRVFEQVWAGVRKLRQHGEG